MHTVRGTLGGFPGVARTPFSGVGKIDRVAPSNGCYPDLRFQRLEHERIARIRLDSMVKRPAQRVYVQILTPARGRFHPSSFVGQL